MDVRSLEGKSILLTAFALAGMVYLERRPPDLPTALGTGETGSGFVIASDTQHSFVLTAAHVLGCDSYGGGCDEDIEVRFGDDPAKTWRARRAYSGSALTNEDLAVVIVDRGNLPPLSLSSPKTGDRITVVGFPQSLVEKARDAPGTLRPRELLGTTGPTLRDRRLLLELSTEPGDSGAPVLDRSGDVVAVVQGRADRSDDIAVSAIDEIVTLVSDAVKASTAHPNSDAASWQRAYLLTRNALHWEELRARYYGISGQRDLQRIEDVDFGDAIAAGSLEAARWFLRLYGTRDAIYQPMQSVTIDAFRVARSAADAGDAGAAYDVHTFLDLLLSINSHGPQKPESSEAEQLSRMYYQESLKARYPYALLEEAGKSPLDQAVFMPLELEAMPGFAKLAANGDALAAYDYANIYAGRPRSPIVATEDPQTPENYLRAVKLGSHAALSILLIYRNQLPDPTVALDVAEREAQHDWAAAASLADIYAKGDGVEKDALHALDLYALGYLSEGYQAKLNALAPTVADAYKGIKTSAGFAAARRAISFVAGNDTNDSGFGVSLSSDDQRTIVAVPSSLLHCDAYERHCRVPPFVRFDGAGDATNYEPSIAYSNGNTLEFGIALLDVPAKNEPVVHVAAAPGPLLFTFNDQFLNSKNIEAYVGILRGVDDDAHVVRCDVPWPELGGPEAVFDLGTGDLVGFASDPIDHAHVTGPAAIRAALDALKRAGSGHT